MDDEKKVNKDWLQPVVLFLYKLANMAYLWWLILYAATLAPLYFIAKWAQDSNIKTEVWIGVLLSYLVITLSFTLPILNRKSQDK